MSARSTGSTAGQIGWLDWGREICGRRERSERRE
jgi:hypothetical protein